MIQRYFQTLKQEFHGYRAKSLVSDLLAGLTVAAVALPLALAFGVAGGADAASGLITAIIAGLVISLLSGGFYQISGPTGAMAAILMSVVARYSMQGVFIATFLAGVFLVLAGLLRLGKLTSFIPAPVITGFTSGIAIIIALGQLDNFFGVASQGETAVLKLFSYATLGFAPNLTAVLVGTGVVLFMVFFPKKWNAVVPASLVGILLATLLSTLLRLDVATVGAIPQTLLPQSRLNLSAIDLSTVNALLLPALSIALLDMIESLLCGASAGRMTGVKLDSNQELLAQGVGNMLLPFFGGIPATAAIARTSVAIKSGAKTRLTGIFHALALLLFMFLLAPVMAKIPLSALAGVLMVTAFRMNEWRTIRYIFSHRFKSSIVLFLVTMLSTVLFDLTVAILIGVGVAIIFLLSKLARIEIAYAKVDHARLGNGANPDSRFDNMEVVYITGPILFANTSRIEEIAGRVQGIGTVLFSMRAVSDIDISGAQSIIGLVEKLRQNGTRVIFCGLSTMANAMLERCGLLELVGEENIFWSVDRALLNDHNSVLTEA